VQLVTDRASRVGVRFGRFVGTEGARQFANLGQFTCVAEGDGKAGMVAKNVKMEDVKGAGLKEGDWAVVADTEFPAVLQGYRVGRIASIRPSRASLQHAEITLQPEGDLSTLPEVMVLVR
jgi:rod shape-determining protein MreC